MCRFSVADLLCVCVMNLLISCYSRKFLACEKKQFTMRGLAADQSTHLLDGLLLIWMAHKYVKTGQIYLSIRPGFGIFVSHLNLGSQHCSLLITGLYATVLDKLCPCKPHAINDWLPCLCGNYNDFKKFWDTSIKDFPQCGVFASIYSCIWCSLVVDFDDHIYFSWVDVWSN